MSNFDPNKLTGSGAATRSESKSSRPQSERLFVEVTNYETPSDGFHFAVGTRVDTGEPVRVRLTSVAERSQDRPDLSADKIKDLYVAGENHRDTLADKDKSKIKLLSFDDAIPMGKNEGGVPEFRAHWPVTMSTDPKAELMVGVAHVKLRDASEIDGKPVKAQAHVELLRESTVAGKDNIDDAMAKALSTKDDNGNAVDALMIMRVFYEDRQVAAMRLFPERVADKVFDQALGDFKEIGKKADADVTLASLHSAKPGFSGLDNENKDVIRAVVAGIKGDELPQINSQDAKVREKAEQYYLGAKQGALVVEVVAAEKIDFGADTRKTYLKDKGRSHLAAYNITEQKGDYQNVHSGYTETVLAVHRFPDGEPYAVFASPKQMWAKSAMVKMNEIAPGVLPQMDLRGPEKANRQEDDGPSPM